MNCIIHLPWICVYHMILMREMSIKILFDGVTVTSYDNWSWWSINFYLWLITYDSSNRIYNKLVIIYESNQCYDSKSRFYPNHVENRFFLNAWAEWICLYMTHESWVMTMTHTFNTEYVFLFIIRNYNDFILKYW